jgi:hypothetical protein
MGRTTTTTIVKPENTTTTTPKKITKPEEIENDPNLMAALHSHAASTPPFGPLANLSAAEFCLKVKQQFGIEIAKPSLVVAVFMKLWDVDQWRHLGSLYIPMDMRLTDVDRL